MNHTLSLFFTTVLDLGRGGLLWRGGGGRGTHGIVEEMDKMDEAEVHLMEVVKIVSLPSEV